MTNPIFRLCTVTPSVWMEPWRRLSLTRHTAGHRLSVWGIRCWFQNRSPLTGIKSEAQCLRHTKFQCNSLHKCSTIFAKGVTSVEIKWCFRNDTNVNYLLHQDWFLATINSSGIYRCELPIACTLDHVCYLVLISSPFMYKTKNLKLLHADTVDAYLTNLDYCNITVLPIDESCKVFVVLCGKSVIESARIWMKLWGISIISSA